MSLFPTFISFLSIWLFLACMVGGIRLLYRPLIYLSIGCFLTTVATVLQATNGLLVVGQLVQLIALLWTGVIALRYNMLPYLQQQKMTLVSLLLFQKPRSEYSD